MSQLGRMSYYLLAFLYLFSSRLGIPTDTFPRTPAIDKPKSKTDPKRAIFERYSLLAALLDGWMMIYFQRGFHAWRSSSTGDGIGKPSFFFPSFEFILIGPSFPEPLIGWSCGGQTTWRHQKKTNPPAFLHSLISNWIRRGGTKKLIAHSLGLISLFFFLYLCYITFSRIPPPPLYK